MSAGPDRIRVDHGEHGWTWEYYSNGRHLATSAHPYRERAAALAALCLVTGVAVELPHGWRGTQAEPYIKAEWSTVTGDPWALVVYVWDSPYARKRRLKIEREAADEAAHA